MHRHLGYTAINVLGLAVGLAACACIGLYVADELSYDDFHPTADWLYRVVTDLKGKGGTQRLGLTSQPAGPTLERTHPEVQRAVRLFGAQQPTVKVGSRFYRNRPFFYAELDLFEAFGATQRLCVRRSRWCSRSERPRPTSAIRIRWAHDRGGRDRIHGDGDRSESAGQHPPAI